MKTGLRRSFHKTVLAKWLASYFFAVIPMLILSFFLYSGYISSTQESIDRFLEAQLQEYSMKVENSVTAVQAACTQLCTVAKTQNIAARSMLKVEDHLAMKGIKATLGSTMTVAPEVSEILVYFKRSGYAITSERIGRLSDLYALTDDRYALWGDWSTLCSMLSLSHSSALYTLPGSQQLFGYYRYSAEISILYSFDIPRLLALYGSTEGFSTQLAFARRHGDVLFASPGADIAPAGIEGQTEFFNDDWLVNITPCLNNAYMLYSAVSRSDISHSVGNRVLRLNLLLIGCISACFVLCAILARRNYNPLAKLMQVADASEPGDMEGNEYERLSTLLEQALADQKKLQTSKKYQQQRKLDTQLLQALRNREAPSRIVESFPKELPEQRFMMIELILVDNLPSADDEEADSDILSICGRLVCERLQAYFTLLPLQTFQRLLFLVQVSGEQPTQQLIIKRVLTESVQLFRDEYSADFQCLVSDALPPAPSFGDMTDRLLRQLDIIRQHSLSNGQVICSYHADSPARYDMLSQLNGLRQALMDGNALSFRMQMQALNERYMDAFLDEGKQTEDEDDEGYRLKCQVIALIKENYYDPNLNVANIADRLGRSPDAVSRAFKQSTHISMLEYIHYTRVTAAQELLQSQPSLTIRRISELCGYSSIDSFQRAFKRIVGTTPGRLRSADAEAKP